MFEFSRQSKNSNIFAGFFMSKHRCKCIYLILPVKTQNWFICSVIWSLISDTNEFLMKFFWICILTTEINLVTLSGILKGKQKLGKIQQIDLNFCFEVKIQTNSFEFVFRQRKSFWSIFTGYLSYFFKLNLLFDRKNRYKKFILSFER